MTALVSDQRNLIYSRDYANDRIGEIAPDSWTKEIERVAFVALPFLSLHPSLRLPISLTLGSTRVYHMASELYSCQKDAATIFYHLANTTLAVGALAATFFGHLLGLVLTTIQDLSIETAHLLSFLKNGQIPEALKSAIKVASHLVYLMLLSQGGLELAILSLGLQAVILVIASMEAFEKGENLEGLGHLVMAAIRIQQSVSVYKQLQRNREIEKIIRARFVGQLHEKWQFPSDHLPVGIEVDGVRIISWNVLNNAYLDWVIIKDSQGLKDSMITDLNQVVQADGLTHRDLTIAEMVTCMTDSSDLIALQECGHPFLQVLESHLPEGWKMVRSFDKPQKDQAVLLYRKDKLAYQPHLSEVTRDSYPSVPKRPLQNGFFSKVGQEGSFRVFNAHIPGDPNLPAREEYARAVHKAHKEGTTTIGLGDNNFQREQMIEAFQKAGFSEFSLHAPWKTNIGPDHKESKAIDLFFVAGASSSRDLRPIEVLSRGNLPEMIDLLNP